MCTKCTQSSLRLAVLLYTQFLHPAVPIDHKCLRLNKCLNLAEVIVDVDHQDPLAPDHSLQSGSSTQDVFGPKSPVVNSVQRVPEPDPIPGISFATRPDPIQF